MKKVLLTLSVIGTGVMSAFAQDAVNAGPLLSLLAVAQEILTRLIPFMVTLAVVVFFFFLIKFIVQSGNPEAKTSNLKGMGLSILAVFVMVSIWGIVGFMASLTGIGQGGSIPVPSVPRPVTP